MNSTRKNTKNSGTTFANANNVNVLSNTEETVISEKNLITSNVYEPESVKVSMITLNLASQDSHPPIEDATIFECRPDFIVEMTQEDYRPLDYDNSLFSPTNMKLYENIANVALNKKKRTQQNIVLRVFQRQGTLAHPTKVQMGYKILKPKGKINAAYIFQSVASTLKLPKYGYSKGMVWTKIQFAESSLLFVNMHLPMKKKSPNLGYSLREKSIALLLKELEKQIDQTTTLIIGGDLNFRMDYTGKNQLTNLLARGFASLQELPFPDPTEKRYTCKFVPLDEASETCQEKRMTSVPKNSTQAEAAAKNLQEECAVKDRIPSRCDRFLFKEGYGKHLEVSYQKTRALSQGSDHNALLACVTIQ